MGAYAKNKLQQQAIEIYAGEERILADNLSRKKYRGETPTFTVGEELNEETEITIITNYEELQSHGLAISTQRLKDIGKKPWRRKQYVIYTLVKNDDRPTIKKQFPDEHYVEHETRSGSFRLIGKNAGPPPTYASEWVSLKQQMPANTIREELEKNSGWVVKNAHAIIAKEQLRNTGLKEPPRKISIPELPIMITKNNEIVCIDPTVDEPRIGIFGTTGTGKSFFAHALLDMAHWHPNWQRRIAIINDSQAENGPWSEPNNDLEHTRYLEQLGITPKPLPIVYLHPTLDDDYEKLFYGDNGFDICLPYDIIVERFNDFFKLDASAKYFQEMKDELKQCRTKEELAALLDEHKKGGLQAGTANKILATLGNVLKNQITDASTGVEPYWTLKKGLSKRTYNPVTACLAAGLIPCIETQTLISYDFFPQYFQYLVGDIFNRQNNDNDFRNQRVWLYVDEVLNVTSTDEKGALTLLTRTVTEGRIRRIGTIIATQNYKKVPSRIRANIKTMVTFNNPDEASTLVKTYNIPPHFTKTIKTLKKHECLAYTTDHFIVYDNNGNRRKARGPFIGGSLPPMSLHKKPLQEEQADE